MNWNRFASVLFGSSLLILLFLSTATIADPNDTTWCRDADGDGYGSIWDSVTSADQPPGYISDCTDCDDRYDFVNPDAIEICDGFDNDCDGTIDQFWPLAGTPCVDGVGACEAVGVFVCNQDGSGIECGAQPGNPSPEICDGIDNDCDGIVDQDWPELGYPCLVGTGECENYGTIICDPVDSAQSICSAVPFAPEQEICDGLDNDCDGVIDNNCVSDVPDSPRPRDFDLGNNVPNPFNPSTSIQFLLPKDDNVHLTIHDVSGKLVRTLIDGEFLTAGSHVITWDGKDQDARSVASGVYFYSLVVGNHKDVKRMALIR